MTQPRLAGNHVANILVIVAIALIPLMYGGLLSSAYQDPIGRLSNLDAAVVDEDVPYEAHLISGQDKIVDVGSVLVDVLTHPEPDQDLGFTWVEMDRPTAERALANGSIAAMLVIPPELSEDVAQLATDNAPDATSTTLDLVTNDGVNYLTGTMATTVSIALEDQIRSVAAQGYVEATLGAFGKIRSGMEEAADGAGQIRDGSGELADGLGELNASIPELADGTEQLEAGAGELAAGTRALQAGVGEYTDGVSQAAQGAALLRSNMPALQGGVAELENGANQLAAGTGQMAAAFRLLSGPIGNLDGMSAQVAAISGQISAELAALVGQCQAELPDSGLCDSLIQLQVRQDEIAGKANQIAATADEAIAGVGQAQAALDQIAAGNAELDGGLRQLQGSIGTTGDTAEAGTVIGGVNSLSAGLNELAAASPDLRTGAGALGAGANALYAGTAELNSGVPELADGVGQLDAGAGELHEGSDELASALDEGTDALPNYTSADTDKIAETVSQLVNVRPIRSNEVAHNGAGFAPMFLSLALWVGAIAIFLVLPALDRNRKPGEPWYMIAVRPGATALVMALLQATAAVILSNALVELNAQRLFAFVGMAMLTSITFVAINQAAIAALAYRGRFVSIVLLLLQITSMGATFPVETMPRFFQWIHPWLPMSYTQLSFRALIAGEGVPGIVPATVGVLLIWLVASLMITLWSAYRRTEGSLAGEQLPYDAALLSDNIPIDERASAEQLAMRRDIKTEMKETLVGTGRTPEGKHAATKTATTRDGT